MFKLKYINKQNKDNYSEIENKSQSYFTSLSHVIC